MHLSSLRFLLLDACLAGAQGTLCPGRAGDIAENGFCYLRGAPDEGLLALLKERWPDRPFVCLSDAWTHALEAEYGARLEKTTRYLMRYEGADADKLRALETLLPQGFLLRDMTSRDIPEHPFHHGARYAPPSSFDTEGIGSLVCRDGKIVCSASSFATFNDNIEVDLSTLPEYRGMHLALACSANLLSRCAHQGLTPHWDAQNETSRHIAERLGFTLDTIYTSHSLKRDS